MPTTSTVMRAAGPVRRPKRLAQEILPGRVLLPHHGGQPACLADRLGDRPVQTTVPPARGVLPRLPPIPHRGEEADLDQHPIPLRGRASPSVLTFFVLEQDSRVLCYATANLIRPEQAEQVMCFADFWKELRARTRPGCTSTVG